MIISFCVRIEYIEHLIDHCLWTQIFSCTKEKISFYQIRGCVSTGSHTKKLLLPFIKYRKQHKQKRYENGAVC